MGLLKITDKILDPEFLKRIIDLERAPNTESWTATEGQTKFTLSNGTYKPNHKVIQVYVDGVKQRVGEAYTEDSATTFTLAEGVPLGTIVEAMWIEPKVPYTVGHKSTHGKGGQDEINVSELAGYKEKVEDKFNQIILNVKDFGAKGDGVTDDTEAISSAITYGSQTRRNIFIPRGDYRITKTLPFPNLTKLYGAGNGSVILCDFAQSGGWVFDETSANTYRWDISDLTFAIKSGATKDVGVLRVEKVLRFCGIKNIRTFDLKRVFYLGSEIHGMFFLDKIGSYYLSGQDGLTAIETKGNTIMMSDIEIAGGFEIGLKMVGSISFKLKGFNIAGSPNALMGKAIHLDSVSGGSLSDAWIEQLRYEGIAQDEIQAVYIKDSKAVSLSEIYMPDGSIFIDGGEVTVENIAYYQASAGLRYLNGAKVNTTRNGLKTQNVGLKAQNYDGVITVENLKQSNVNLLPNPLLRRGIPNPYTSSNANVTLSDELTDKVSGDRSVRVSSTANYQGVVITLNSLIIGRTYTIRALVKKVSGISHVTMVANSGASTSIDYPCQLRQSKSTDFHEISYIFSATATTAVIRVQNVFSAGSATGEFLLDSVALYEGYSECNPSFETTSKLLSNAAPTSGNWLVGEKVENTNPTAGGYVGWICTSGGTVGTWKGYGLIQT
ncbi:hypothetical protein BEH_07150 [Priestia filamentosa]|uniref:Rhamnogalacturonase A/B/Epimerase-like pectate lyase domain-containing protein n=1 Tax=Priestia filamentosa TaxID=1402861 RepID=A0A0H4KCR1_9BACI|nr:glycosyl hydrolase family 28-related protein [Priestia filamentosa]AKO91897.1 hypothetical protein BEH_07150 [Priestia filamentosa]